MPLHWELSWELREREATATGGSRSGRLLGEERSEGLGTTKEVLSIGFDSKDFLGFPIL